MNEEPERPLDDVCMLCGEEKPMQGKEVCSKCGSDARMLGQEAEFLLGDTADPPEY